MRSRILRGIGVFFLCVIVGAASFVAGGYLGVVEVVKELKDPGRVSTHPTYIYSAPIGDTDGSRRVIGTLFQGQNRETASKDEMPLSLLNALVAKEDERFRTHGGVDVWGIMRALYVDIRAGEAVEGASTITQQYVRNAYLSQDRTVTRKVKEALIAVEIERVNPSKDDILVDYMNTVYFGSNAYGVAAASETYFDKSVEDLTIAESATLVGLLWSPSTLGVDAEAARYQRDLVLRKMFDTGYITEQDYTAALEQPLPEKWPAAPMVESGLEGSAATRDFAEMVQGELIEKYGANTVYQGGLNVYTTLDLEMQVSARDIVYGPEGYLPDPRGPDLALVSIDPETGFIRTMLGNRDQDSQFSLATQGRRQPGSSFKPFAMIAALEQGIDPDTKFVSEKKTYQVDVGLDKPEEWKVQNYDGIERGKISLKEALWWSDNTVFTELVMNAGGKGLENGPESIVDVAKRLGIHADFGEPPNPSVVLGSKEVSPLDMAAAYATIANGGEKVEPTTIARVTTNQGDEGEKVIYDAPDHPDGEQVISPKIADEITRIMIGDVTEGIARKASLKGQPVAGKTGTSENFFDAWFIGFTPHMVTGIWMGYAEGGETLEYTLDYARKLNGLSGGITPAEIWSTYSQDTLAGKPIREFENVGMTLEEQIHGPEDRPQPPEADEPPAKAENGRTRNAPGRNAPGRGRR
ncbi:MAG: transglycosylase domain-containing protein [Rubrobacter sp.]|nr:transglycosylase domain-containing protein [Rubrobacter sp.]